MTVTCPSKIKQPFVALLLAAGEGSRLGRLPKSLMRIEGQTLLERQIVALWDAGAKLIVVVTGHFFSDIEAELKRLQDRFSDHLHIVRNAEPERGQQSSVSLGLTTLATREAHLPVLIALADQPLMQAADYTACVNAFYNRPNGRAMMYPVVNQQRGNPVLLSNPIMREVLESGLSCREFINTHTENIHHFVTDCDHFVFDLDSLSDLDTFEKRTGMTLALPKN